MIKLLIIVVILMLLIENGFAAELVLSGTVPDKGFEIINNQPVPQPGSQLKMTFDKKTNIVKVEAL